MTSRFVPCGTAAGHRRARWHVLAALLWVHLGVAAAGPAPAPASRPNILWITTEDINPHLGCYGDPYARTPNLDRFAARSIRYTHAFASAPVCSPARSCLITGRYATALGTMHLRSRFPVPAWVKGFPSYLRAAGYFCSNNAKTDYNLADERAFIEATWDQCGPRAHWRQRRPGQPFFSVFNCMLTHQSFTGVLPWKDFEDAVAPHLGPADRHDPAQAPVPPYYPDTPTVRKTLARYHDCITAMDRGFFARLLQELEADGLADDTIVFFYGDNGAGLPRHKRVLHDSGLRVPLLIHFPPKFQHLAPGAPGSVTDRLVSFVDFAPTVLNLVGLPVPDSMQGAAFLGPAAGPPREFVHGARDRVDEARDLARSVRDGRYLYIRNYHPHLSWGPPEGYSDQAEIRRELLDLARAGRLEASQLAYAGLRRPLEELYDSERDPWQIHNLADDPAHAAVLERLRAEQRRWLLASRDTAFVTESDMAERARGRTPHAVAAEAAAYDLPRLLEVAESVGRPSRVDRQMAWLRDPDAGVRFWAAVGLRSAGDVAGPAREALTAALADRSAAVRIEAAGALLALGEDATALRVLERDLQGDQLDTVLHAARTAQLLGDRVKPLRAVLERVLQTARAGERTEDRWMFVRFSLNAALERWRGRAGDPAP